MQSARLVITSCLNRQMELRRVKAIFGTLVLEQGAREQSTRACEREREKDYLTLRGSTAA